MVSIPQLNLKIRLQILAPGVSCWQLLIKETRRHILITATIMEVNKGNFDIGIALSEIF
jgi:hypothetical protein